MMHGKRERIRNALARFQRDTVGRATQPPTQAQGAGRGPVPPGPGGGNVGLNDPATGLHYFVLGVSSLGGPDVLA